MNVSYKEKYLKYKNKYFELKNQFKKGGNGEQQDPITGEKIADIDPKNIIIIDNIPFNIESIYDWVFIGKKNFLPTRSGNTVFVDEKKPISKNDIQRIFKQALELGILKNMNFENKDPISDVKIVDIQPEYIIVIDNKPYDVRSMFDWVFKYKQDFFPLRGNDMIYNDVNPISEEDIERIFKQAMNIESIRNEYLNIKDPVSKEKIVDLSDYLIIINNRPYDLRGIYRWIKEYGQTEYLVESTGDTFIVDKTNPLSPSDLERILKKAEAMNL